MKWILCTLALLGMSTTPAADFQKPYDKGCTEREDVFVFSETPSVRSIGNDKYEITFATKGYCDVTASIIDRDGKVVRHLGSGVLGKNAPSPFQKDALKQKIFWNGKDDLDVYVPKPKQMRVQVSLGLKPTFHKRLGAVSPYNVPGYVWGITAGPEEVYVFVKAARLTLRVFDHDGRYLRTLLSPPANMPEEKIKGLSWVEYEPGRRARHGASIYASTALYAQTFPSPMESHYGAMICRPLLLDKRLILFNAGGEFDKKFKSKWHTLNTDGSTTVDGIDGTPFAPEHFNAHGVPQAALSPDGKWIYLATSGGVILGSKMARDSKSVVLRYALGKHKPAEVFLGQKNGILGSDNHSFNKPCSVDCDASGNVYVADHYNQRIQVFSDKGKYLKSIPVDCPRLVRLHQKTGAIYVLHSGRVQGKSVDRLTKLQSLEHPKEVYHVDGLGGSILALDSWSSKPRLWMTGSGSQRLDAHALKLGAKSGKGLSMPNVVIWEEDGKNLRKILDFEEKARAENGTEYFKWSGMRGHGFDKVVGDPLREQVYFRQLKAGKSGQDRWHFDLKTGKNLGAYKVRGKYEDLSFDKRGHMHVHFNPGFYVPGVGRVDPSLLETLKGSKGVPRTQYPEVPYDYGIISKDRLWKGVLPVMDQPGGKFFQDGMGVNMQGDIAVESNIFYVPKLPGEGFADYGSHCGTKRYAAWKQQIQTMLNKGKTVYSIKRQPGIPLSGGTIWTFDHTGELREECAVIGGKLITGVQIDEDSRLYFSLGKAERTRMVDGRPFLAGNTGRYGVPGPKKKSKTASFPFTGTFIKSGPKKVRILQRKSIVPLDPPPLRLLDLDGGWVEGAAWMYAGATGMVSHACSCPTMRASIDWYKRSYIPEGYRHSIGILDTNGNLILHVGQYGNFDSASGPKSQVPVGGDGIGITLPRFIGTTDNYLCFEDQGARLMALKLNYHEQKVVGIKKR